MAPHVVADLRGQRFGPRRVVVVAAAGDEDRPRALGRLQEGRVCAKEIDVVVGGHVAAAAPSSRCRPQSRRSSTASGWPLRARSAVSDVGLVRGHVLQPLRHFARRARAEIAVDVGVGADQFGEVQEFVGAEFVGLRHAAPVRVQASPDACRAGRCRRASGIRRRSSRPASAPPAHAGRAARRRRRCESRGCWGSRSSRPPTRLHRCPGRGARQTVHKYADRSSRPTDRHESRRSRRNPVPAVQGPCKSILGSGKRSEQRGQFADIGRHSWDPLHEGVRPIVFGPAHRRL